MRKSWTEYMCTMFGAHAESRVSRTETPSSPSRHLNEQIQFPVKHANRKRCERAQFSTRAPWAERHVSKRINAEFVSSCSCTNKYIQSYVKILVLESILKNTVCYVLYSFVKNWMCIIILDALSLKVTTSNLQELSMSLMLIQENERKKIAHCSWLNHL